MIPRPYQKEAIQDIVHGQNGLILNDRAKYISACGTGKTLTSLWSVEEYVNTLGEPSSIVVYLFPSLELIRQSFDQYKEEISLPNYKAFAICSDKTIGDCELSPENVKVYLDEVQATTNEAEIKNAIVGYRENNLFIYCTYQSSDVLGRVLVDMGITADITVFDEAHRTSQVEKKASKFNMAYALSDDRFPSAKRLFMTATPRHYVYTSKKKKGGFTEISEDTVLAYSMDDEKHYGKMAHELPMRKAIGLGIVADYKIVCILLDKAKILEQAKLEYTNDKHAEAAVGLAIDKAKSLAVLSAIDVLGVNKAIAFHSSADESRKFIDFIAPHTSLNVRHIDGYMNQQDRQEALSVLKGADGSILSNVKLLSEGVDVPSVDMVAFMSNTKSEVDIVQRVGRAQRIIKDQPGKIGYIFIPIIVEKENLSLEKAQKHKGFGNLVSIVNSLKEIDSQLVDYVKITSATSNDTSSTKRNGATDKGLVPIDDGGMINIYNGDDADMTKSDGQQNGSSIRIVLSQSLLENVKMAIKAVVVDSWDQMLINLKDFFKTYNTMPQKKQKLGIWIDNQKIQYRAGKLSREKELKLINVVGLEFLEKIGKEDFKARLKIVTEFYKKNGRLPANNLKNKEEKSLHAFVQRQRALHRVGKLSKEKELKLIDAFTPSFFLIKERKVIDFNVMVEKINEFYESYGRLPSRSSVDFEKQMYKWLIWTRHCYYEKKLNAIKENIFRGLSKSSVKPPPSGGGYKRPIQECLAAECIA